MIRKKKSYLHFKLSYRSRKVGRAILKPRSVVVYSIIGLGVLAYVLTQSIKLKLYAPEYRIEKVLFTSGSMQIYNDEVLLSNIVDLYLGSYYSTLRLGNHSSQQLKSYLKQVPYIHSVNPVSFENNAIVLDVVFNKPLLRIQYSSSQYAIYDNHHFLPLFSGNTLGMNTPLVLLPLYLSGNLNSLSGLFYDLDANKLLLDSMLLQSSPIHGTISYMPGGEKYVIRNPLQKVYFNVKKDINKQLALLYDLQQHYTGFDALKIIDVGSLENPIVL